MEIFIARESGFCFGVRRAVKIACEAREKWGKVYTYGELIHNKQYVEKLKQNGIKAAESIKDIPEGAVVIIRSHGISPKEEAELKKRFKVIDATCPYVKKSQKFASKAVRGGTELVIFGDRQHPEIKGILGYTQGSGIVISDPEEVLKLPFNPKRAVISQTTNDLEDYKKFVGNLLETTEKLTVYQTICSSTIEKHRAAREIASRVDLMLVIGGKHSSNTRKLYKACKKIQPNTYHIETAEELNLIEWENCERIGISAGASTPDFIIEEVVEKIKEGKNGRGKKER